MDDIVRALNLFAGIISVCGLIALALNLDYQYLPQDDSFYWTVRPYFGTVLKPVILCCVTFMAMRMVYGNLVRR